MYPIKDLMKYYPVVRKHIRANSGSNAEAEDIFQEGLLIYCEKVAQPGFVLSSDPKTFLFGICRNLWQNELRKKGKMPASSKDDLPEVGNAPAEMEEEKIHLAEKALSFLEEKCRRILQLFYYEKSSLENIAKCMNLISVTAARNQKFQCLEKARKKFKELDAQTA